MKFFFSVEIGRGGVASYIRSDISFKLNYFLPNEIVERVSHSMPHTKSITTGIIYRLFTDFI